MISGTYAFFLPSAHAQELTTSTAKGLAIINQVAGLNLAKYTVTSETFSQNNSTFLGIAPEEDIEYNLSAQGSNLNVLCSFTSGNLEHMQVLNNTGSPILTKSEIPNAVGMAQNLLNNYQTYTASSIYGQIASTLNNVDASKNVTLTLGNTQLEVNSTGNEHTNFIWTYSVNGILAPNKFVAIGYTNNSLSYFVDNWQLYKVGNTAVNLSKNDAETIALNAAEAHSWSVTLDNDTFDPSNFNSSNVAFSALIFSASSYADAAHNGDPSTLYPVWRVGVQLNKWYGDLDGIEVDMYADTGQVISAQEALSTLTPTMIPQTNVNSTASVPVNSQASNLNIQTVNGQTS